MVRFTVYVAMAFVTAFVLMSWAARGFPTHVRSLVSAAPLSAPVNHKFGDDTAQKKHAAAVQEQLATPENTRRDDIRLATLQAANAYALAPCGPGFKDELIKTLSVYAKAYTDMRGCTFIGCSDKKVEAAGAAFDSPLDKRVQAALKDAFEQGGITLEDFSPSLRVSVVSFTQGPGSAASRCVTGMQGGARN